MSKPRIAVLVDRKGWAYDVIAEALAAHLPQYRFTIHLASAVECINQRHGEYDLIFAMGWKWPNQEIKTPRNKTVSVCHSFRTLKGKSLDHWCEYMSERYCAMGAVNKRLVDLLESYLPVVYYTPNGVDTERFRPGPVRSYGKMMAGWSGRGDDLEFRGVPIMHEACELAGWDLRINIANHSHIPHNDMPEWYQGLDLYLCLSESEGCSCSMLEAAACGLPIIATNTGVSQEMVLDGETGFVARRELLDEEIGSECLADKLSGFDREKCQEMGRNMRALIERDWTWATQAEKWNRLIEAGLTCAM